MKKSVFLAVAAWSAWLLTGCGGGAEGEDTLMSSEPPADEQPYVNPGYDHKDPSGGEVHSMACQSSWDPAIAEARRLIGIYCGSISACGNNDSYGHHDLKLSNGNYCGCYNYIWNNRGNYPWNTLQVIYHEPYACSWNHIHLQVMNTCNYKHMNLDEGYNGTQNDCYDQESSTYTDKYFCQAGSRKGTCNN
jgi:hypothetical protein